MLADRSWTFMPSSIRELKGKGNTRKNYFKTFWTLTRCWHFIWDSRQLWLFFTFAIFHQVTEDQCENTTNVKSWAHSDNAVHVKILWKKKKDSESYNYCSINIGTKLNLYISVDSLRYVASNSFRRDKKIYPCFPHYVCCSQKNDCVGSSVNSLSRRDCGIF